MNTCWNYHGNPMYENNMFHRSPMGHTTTNTTVVIEKHVAFTMLCKADGYTLLFCTI